MYFFFAQFRAFAQIVARPLVSAAIAEERTSPGADLVHYLDDRRDPFAQLRKLPGCAGIYATAYSSD
jgi:hypothetical protein